LQQSDDAIDTTHYGLLRFARNDAAKAQLRGR